MAMMTLEAMLKFRDQYRETIAEHHSGWVHMLSVLAVGLGLVIIALLQVQSAFLCSSS